MLSTSKLVGIAGTLTFRSWTQRHGRIAHDR